MWMSFSITSLLELSWITVLLRRAKSIIVDHRTMLLLLCTMFSWFCPLHSACVHAETIMENLQAANTEFAFNFFKILSQKNEYQNVFFAPWSISSTLGMVYMGAKGNTAKQMAKVLEFNKVGGDEVDIPQMTSCGIMQQIQKKPYPVAIQKIQAENNINSSFKALSDAINQSSEKYILESANKLFGEKSSRFKEEYLRLCKEYYSAEPQSVNFREDANEARKEINSWVETQTKGKILELLPEGSVDDETRLVLVNAIYFKGKWKTPFQNKAKRPQPFRVNLTERKPVQIMYLQDKLHIGYIKELKAQILELPYEGDVSMFILLPDEIADSSTGLELLEREMTYEKINQWIENATMESNDVHVFLPKFKLENNYELKPILQSMGMKDAFNISQANFSGMSEGNDLFLSEVFHQAAVEVNEEGTEAAAGTGGVMSGRTGHIGLQFVADHPFLFFIRHNKTNTILFFGRFCSP
ncbi:plasminogen activator inhibitor 2 isoform X1 [Antechinus flavipes]|uniref:plasminogen activator inhibitor 2 isoform X1 n=2 Tax=Antechinus flavipes TaxID=38775 RepID=UPI002235DF12|nr:plasminogen activator inhibitor 2 isoform X1 [Antechinus flavipes]